MPKNRFNGKKVREIEREVLRALCSSSTTAKTWDQLLSRLAGHRWQEPDHGVVYEALRRIRSHDSKTRREELPAQATRMGFPDINWENYFEFAGLDSPKLERLIGDLEELTAP